MPLRQWTQVQEVPWRDVKRRGPPDTRGSAPEVATSGRWRGAPPLRAEAQFKRRTAGEGSMVQVAVARGRQESASLQFGAERLLRCPPTGSCRPIAADAKFAGNGSNAPVTRRSLGAPDLRRSHSAAAPDCAPSRSPPGAPAALRRVPSYRSDCARRHPRHSERACRSWSWPHRHARADPARCGCRSLPAAGAWRRRAAGCVASQAW